MYHIMNTHLIHHRVNHCSNHLVIGISSSLFRMRNRESSVLQESRRRIINRIINKYKVIIPKIVGLR